MHGARLFPARLATAFWKKIHTAAGFSPSSPQKDSKTCATAPSDYASGATSAGVEVDHQGLQAISHIEKPFSYIDSLGVWGGGDMPHLYIR